MVNIYNPNYSSHPTQQQRHAVGRLAVSVTVQHVQVPPNATFIISGGHKLASTTPPHPSLRPRYHAEQQPLADGIALAASELSFGEGLGLERPGDEGAISDERL